MTDAADAGILFMNINGVNLTHAERDVNRDGIVDGADAGFMFAEFDVESYGSTDLFLTILGHTELYTGLDFDAEVWLQYNGARYYDAKVGRWISEDPIGFAAGDYNLSRYVANSPTNAPDPLGLQSVSRTSGFRSRQVSYTTEDLGYADKSKNIYAPIILKKRTIIGSIDERRHGAGEITLKANAVRDGHFRLVSGFVPIYKKTGNYGLTSSVFHLLWMKHGDKLSANTPLYWGSNEGKGICTQVVVFLAGFAELEPPGPEINLTIPLPGNIGIDIGRGAAAISVGVLEAQFGASPSTELESIYSPGPPDIVLTVAISGDGQSIRLGKELRPFQEES